MGRLGRLLGCRKSGLAAFSRLTEGMNRLQVKDLRSSILLTPAKPELRNLIAFGDPGLRRLKYVIYSRERRGVVHWRINV